MTRPAGSVWIRQAEPADEPFLAALESSAPDSGTLGLRLRLRIGYLSLAARYPAPRGFVAVDEAGSVVGMIFSSTAPTRCAGRTVSGVYLFSLRVHPAARRRGIGSALVRHAWEEACSGAGAEIGWAGVMDGNAASLRTFARVGFAWYRDLAVRIVPRLAASWGGPYGETGDLVVRQGRHDDLDRLVTALEAAHAGHQLWRPLDADVLREGLEAANHSIDDLWLALDGVGGIRAASAIFDVGRVADIRVAGFPGLPRSLYPVLKPIVSRIPIRPLLLRHALLGEASHHLIHRLLPAYGGYTTSLSIVVDRCDPVWSTIRRLPGLTGRVSVVVRGTAALDRAAPLAPL